ncbi:hypothetical protein LTR37_008065 [Vermiconidia calcicola]|uniref:Uncharacterized protein n=1 Tax=Vermiconidia calcicola TaxID=1690605 RepID=A0ACC3NBX2_9PEZI|nr:hypothetical protein LTR37_008065 [Vermiconidia calcicola]
MPSSSSTRRTRLQQRDGSPAGTGSSSRDQRGRRSARKETSPSAVEADVLNRLPTASPTGSGQNGHHDLGPFVDALVGLVNLARLDRANGFEMRSLKREQDERIAELDHLRLELRYSQKGLRRQRRENGNTDEDIQRDIEQLTESSAEASSRIQTLNSVKDH